MKVYTIDIAYEFWDRNIYAKKRDAEEALAYQIDREITSSKLSAERWGTKYEPYHYSDYEVMEIEIIG